MPKEVFRCLVEHIRGVYAVMGTADPPSTPLVLYALAGFDSEPTVSELADAAGVSLKTASRTLKMLRKQGWVVLKEDPQDTRMKRVALTRSGESATAVLGSSYVEIAHRVIAHTSREHPVPEVEPTRATRAKKARSTTHRKVLAALVTLQVTAGVTLGNYVKHVLGNTGLITATDTLSDGHRVGSITLW